MFSSLCHVIARAPCIYNDMKLYNRQVCMRVLTSMQNIATIQHDLPFMQHPSPVRFQVCMHRRLQRCIPARHPRDKPFSGGGCHVFVRVYFSFTVMMLDARAKELIMLGNICSHMACIPKTCISSHDRAECSFCGRAGHTFAQDSCLTYGRTVDTTGSKGSQWCWPQAMVPRAQAGERQDFHQTVQMGSVLHCLHPGTFDG